ncbi:MAG TPA: DUF6600 domain-containing protein [Usitatibacter sp.]|nr:DUF6600 domain-containing protein [Usitatibacter sp.]
MRSIAFFLLSLAALAAPALAQEVPGRVGRVAWIEGDVALYQDPDRGWEAAYVNSPFTSRNSLWTDSGARAEAQVGPIALRLDELSQLDVSRLDDDVLDATLEQGVLAVRVHHRERGTTIRLSTQQASFTLDAEGRYRLDADPDRAQSRLSVFSGSASLQTASGRVRIRAGQSIVVWGEDRPSYAFEDAYPTEFDRWAEARDERWVERRAPQYVSFEMTGYEDLDQYGEWSQDAVYGAVWFPTRVQEDWAPYRYGRWTYLEPWGWTWVDTEPWGYAPFHYGRWVQIRDRWAWCPGRRVANPTWAPALVGFIGGSGWSLSAASGGPVIGWYPLAPSEPYRPWYRASRSYETKVNAAVIKVPERVAREHRELNRERAATAVRRDVLVTQKPVAQARVALAPQVVRAAPAITAPATALPSRNEVREAHREQASRNPATRAGPPAARAPVIAGAPSTSRAAPNAAAPSPPNTAANAVARPSFAKPRVAPKAAPKGATPPASANPAVARTPTPKTGSPSQPAARGEERGAPGEANANRTRDAREAQQRAQKDAAEARQRAAEAQQKGAAEAQQRAQKDAAEARQRAAEAQQKGAAEAQQRARKDAADRERASREAQQRASQEAQQRAQKNAAEAEQRAAEARRNATQESQQRAAQASERAAQQAERAAQQRAAQEAQQRAAQQAQQRAAQEAQQRAQQAQQRAAQEAQQRAAQQAQQRAAQEAQQRAAQEAAQRAAQEKARAAREARPSPRGEEASKDKGHDGDNRGQ